MFVGHIPNVNYTTIIIVTYNITVFSPFMFIITPNRPPIAIRVGITSIGSQSPFTNSCPEIEQKRAFM
jgi:hypothetical protein